jgi:hypothetical protein
MKMLGLSGATALNDGVGVREVIDGALDARYIGRMSLP